MHLNTIVSLLSILGFCSGQLLEIVQTKGPIQKMISLFKQNRSSSAGKEFGTLLKVLTPSDINLVDSYIKDTVNSTNKNLRSGLNEAKYLTSVLKFQEKAGGFSSDLPTYEPYSLLQKTNRVTRNLLTLFRETGQYFSSIVLALSDVLYNYTVVGSSNSEWEVPSKDVKSIGQDGIELHDLLNELTQNINELRKCLIKIAKGVPKLNLAQFGIDPASQFNATEIDLANIAAGFDATKKMVDTIAEAYEQTDSMSMDQAKPIALAVKNVIAPICFTIIQYYKTGLNAESLEKHLTSIIADLTNA